MLSRTVHRFLRNRNPVPIFVFWVLFFSMSLCPRIQAQTCAALDIQLQSDIRSSCDQIILSMQQDLMNRPFLYVANKEAGLTIYDISDLNDPQFISEVPTDQFASLDVMDLFQVGHMLYLAIGNHFTNPQSGGLALVDISDPHTPLVTDYFVVPGSNSGAGDIQVLDQTAYIGAMQSGLVLLDISAANDVKLISQFIPDIDFPVSNPNSDLYNARGIYIVGDIIYLSFDAGGLRIIDCSDRSNPTEIGRYANPITYQPINLPRAYNHSVVDGRFLYATVDYCGVEVLDISDPNDVQLIGSWNPYDCPTNNWFNTPVHTNGLHLDTISNRLFLATGKSDLIVLDVSDPTQPDSCATFGNSTNDYAVWDLHVTDKEIYLSYICALVPFLSNQTGIKVLSYSSTIVAAKEITVPDFVIYPNPVQSHLTLRSVPQGRHLWVIYDNLGNRLDEGVILGSNDPKSIDVSGLLDGLYFLKMQSPYKTQTHKFIVVNK